MDSDTFNEARKLYPGSKLGNDTEFKNFKKKHRDWKNALPLLKSAINRQIQWRAEANGEFREPWRGFSRWINTRYWEFQPPGKPKLGPKLCKPHGKPSVGSVSGKGVYCSRECRKLIAGW